MILVIVILLLVVGTVLFHFLSPWWFTPIASNWSAIDDTISITMWVTGVVFIAVNLFVAYAIYKFRYNKNRKAAYEPENKKLEIWLTVGTSLGIAAMLAPGLIVWANFVQVPDEAAEIEVLAQQWRWSYRFPGQDGKLGNVSTHLVSESNPFGINPQDPAGQDDILVAGNEVHLPEGKPVKVLLRSLDVLHNFAVPQFRVKMDLVPGMVSYFWFTPTRAGTYEILCQELCGLAHHAMRGQVVVDTPQEYQNWLNSHPTFSQTQIVVKGDPHTGQSLYAVCAACHGMEGEGNALTNSPKLSGLSGWYLEHQLQLYKQKIRGAHKEDIYGRQMAPMAAVLADDTAMRNVLAYIDTLPDKPAVDTITGNVNRGRNYYVNCASCHGDRGEGNFFMQAPRLAGQQDWYLKRQLQNFKKGIRGGHPDDFNGRQMAMMAAILKSEQAIDDLVAYLNTL